MLDMRRAGLTRGPRGLDAADREVMSHMCFGPFGCAYGVAGHSLQEAREGETHHHEPVRSLYGATNVKGTTAMDPTS